MENMFELLRKKLDEARFPITDLKQGITINGIQQTDDAVLYERVLQIVDEIEAEYNNGWIPFRIRLPEKEGVYLVQNWASDVTINFFSQTYNAFMGIVKPVAWQPLPETCSVYALLLSNRKIVEEDDETYKFCIVADEITDSLEELQEKYKDEIEALGYRYVVGVDKVEKEMY